MSLISGKPVLEQKINNCAYNAMYEAFMTTCGAGSADPSVTAMIQKNMDVAAKKYARKFADELAKSLADAVYEFTKDITIVLAPSGALLSPQTPTGVTAVTGTSSTIIGDISVT